MRESAYTATDIYKLFDIFDIPPISTDRKNEMNEIAEGGEIIRAIHNFLYNFKNIFFPY